jgi:hypothetical protein
MPLLVSTCFGIDLFDLHLAWFGQSPRTLGHSSGGARGLMIGVHGGAPAAKILDLGVAHEVKKKTILQKIQFFPVSCAPPKATHGSAPGHKHQVMLGCLVDQRRMIGGGKRVKHPKERK